jgi:hypothetical protein
MAWTAVRVHEIATAASDGNTAVVQAAALLAAIVAALAVLAIAAKLLRIAEFDEALGRLTQPVRKLLDR